MQTTDKTKFGTLMMAVGQMYGKELDKKLLEIWWNAMQNYDFESVKQALNAHVLNPDNGQFMPKPADVVRYLSGRSDTQALQAWSKVLRAITTHGVYETVVFDDPIIHVVIEEMGGWVQLCKMKVEEQSFKARDFERRYAAYVGKPLSYYPNKLCGIFNNDEAVLIGEEKKALLILHSDMQKNLSFTKQKITLNLEKR